MTPTNTLTDVRSGIEAANSRIMGAFGRRDADAVATAYTADGMLLPPGSDMIKGREAIAEFWRKTIGTGMGGVELETVEAESTGDAAYEIGRYRISGTDGQQVDHGKYVVIWKQEGGAFKVHRDIWCSSVPQNG